MMTGILFVECRPRPPIVRSGEREPCGGRSLSSPLFLLFKGL